MTYKNTIFSLLLVILVGIATWTTFLSYRPQNVSAAKTIHLPDAFMEDVTSVIMDKQGKPTMKIVTSKLVHFADNDTTHFTTPQLTLYRKSPQPWFITSNFAKAIQGMDKINFWENVTIHHAADGKNPATFIKTITLWVQPNKKIAETNEFITLTQPNVVVKATGMYADMNSGDIKFLSQARGEYVPSS